MKFKEFAARVKAAPRTAEDGSVLAYGFTPEGGGNPLAVMWCDDCNRPHTHGWAEGGRVEHCTPGWKTRYSGKGYTLKLAVLPS